MFNTSTTIVLLQLWAIEAPFSSGLNGASPNLLSCVYFCLTSAPTLDGAGRHNPARRGLPPWGALVRCCANIAVRAGPGSGGRSRPPRAAALGRPSPLLREYRRPRRTGQRRHDPARRGLPPWGALVRCCANIAVRAGPPCAQRCVRAKRAAPACVPWPGWRHTVWQYPLQREKRDRRR